MMKVINRELGLPILLTWLLLAAGHDMSATGTEGHLFVIERSLNANTIAYDVRIDSAGRLDCTTPLHAYWVMSADRGQVEELSPFERACAFGYDIGHCGDDRCEVTLRALRSRPIRIELGGGTARARARIGGHEGILRRVFVSLRRGGLFPRVESIDLCGVSRESGEPLCERIAAR